MNTQIATKDGILSPMSSAHFQEQGPECAAVSGCLFGTNGGGVVRMMAGELDHEGISESVEYVKGLIDKEIAAGIDLARIVVFGFSQGAHIALKTMLSADGTLGGCVALSTMLPPIKSEVYSFGTVKVMEPIHS